MSRNRVIDVGNCSADHSSLRCVVELLNSDLVRAHTVPEALQLMREQPAKLVIVNRIMDRDGSEGLELIRQAQQDESLKSVPIMLVSNYPDAQQAAISAGAVPGFGKSQLFTPETRELISQYLS